MKNKTIKIIYWIVTILFTLFFLIDAVIKLIPIDEAVEIMQHLGYPTYVLTILGISSILGVIGILQTKYRTLREWAYAGFTFHFLGAFASRAFVSDGFWLIISPLLFMSFMFISYFLGKKIY